MSRKTSKWFLGAFVFTLTFQVASLVILPRSEAKDLTDVLVQGFPPVIGANDISAGVEAFSPAFAQAVAQAVQQVPVASVAPAFSYRYNPALSIFERSTGVPGPLFSERALTLGKGQLNVSLGYSYVDFSDLNGDDLNNITGPGLFNSPDSSNPLRSVQLANGNTAFFSLLSAAELRTSLDMNAHIIAPSLRYGITENWDVGLTVPIIDTFLRVRNKSIPVADADTRDAQFVQVKNPQGTILLSGIQLNPALGGDLTKVRFQQTARSASTVGKSAGSATGVGNITLRTKYRLWQTETGGAALGLNLLLPRSENAQRDFLGIDQTHLNTFVYLSEVLWDRVEPHLNMGVDINAEDVSRSSFLYAVGATLLVWKNLSLVVDFLGRSEFEGLDVKVPPNGFYDGVVLNRPSNTCTAASPCFISNFVSSPFLPIKIERNDIVDFSFGLRYAIGTQGSIFFGGLIPLNDDGFRADFIPSGGVEYTF